VPLSAASHDPPGGVNVYVTVIVGASAVGLAVAPVTDQAGRPAAGDRDVVHVDRRGRHVVRVRVRDGDGPGRAAGRGDVPGAPIVAVGPVLADRFTANDPVAAATPAPFASVTAPAGTVIAYVPSSAASHVPPGAATV
jgi:hypothetical protein